MQGFRRTKSPGRRPKCAGVPKNYGDRDERFPGSTIPLQLPIRSNEHTAVPGRYREEVACVPAVMRHS